MLRDILTHAASEPDRRRLQTIEDSGAITSAAYYNETLPADTVGRVALPELHQTFSLVAPFKPDTYRTIIISRNRGGVKSRRRWSARGRSDGDTGLER